MNSGCQALVLQNLHGNTESSRRSLESHGCHFDTLFGWICPLESEEKILNVINDNKLKCTIAKRIVPNNPITMTFAQKKTKKMETKINNLEKQIFEDSNRLLTDIYRYDRNLRPEDFDVKPSIDEKSDLKIRLENDFHERRLHLKQEEVKLNQLRETWSLRQEKMSVDGILVEQGKIHEAVDAAEQLLREKDLGIYQRAGRLVRITVAQSLPKRKTLEIVKEEAKEFMISHEGIKRSLESLVIVEVDTAYLLELLTRHIPWLKLDSRTNCVKPIDCPEKVAKLLLARRQWNLPILTGVIQAPTIFSSGNILDKPGYDPNSGLYLHVRGPFPPISQNPSLEYAQTQVEIIKKLLAGFPFDGGESFSVAVSAMLTALVRKSISTAPLHGFTAPKMGTGKSLLADVVSLIATGKPNSVIPQADNEPEERKRLMAVLLDGDPIICFDNIERPFGSAALCLVLTQQELKDRILGETRNMAVSTRATFLATGNNLTFIGDLSTRAILCKLDPKMERPEERLFDINLHQYLEEHREEIVVALLTMIKAYVVAGKPKQNIKPYGRFEDWSDFVRSTIVWVGLPDPCASRKEIENADPIRTILINLLQAWHDLHGSKSIKVKQLILSADEKKDEKGETLKEALQEFASDGKGGVSQISLGKQLAFYKNRIENGYKIEMAGKSHHAAQWRVVKEVS